MFKKDYIILSIVFLIGLVLRVLYSLYMYKNNVMSNFADDYHYLEYAKQIQQQGILVKDISMLKEAMVAPLLPWILTLQIYIFGESWFNIFIFNSFFGALFPIALFWGLKPYFSKLPLLLSSFILAINPMIIYLTPSSGKETIMYYFNLILITSFLTCLKSKNIARSHIIFSSIYSLSLYADERYLMFLPFFFLCYLFFRSKEKYMIKTIFILIGILSIIQLPWVFRNYMVYNRIILITERTDKLTNIFRTEDSTKPFIEKSLDKNYLSEEEIELIIDGDLNKYDNGKPINEKKLAFIRLGNKPYKFNFIERSWVNFYSFWKVFDFRDEFVSDGFKFHGKWNLKHNLSSIFFYGLFLPFFLYYGFKQKNNIYISIPFLFVLYSSLIHMFFVPFSSDRYRTPYDFIIIVLSIQFLIPMVAKEIGLKNILINKNNY